MASLIKKGRVRTQQQVHTPNESLPPTILHDFDFYKQKYLSTNISIPFQEHEWTDIQNDLVEHPDNELWKNDEPTMITERANQFHWFADVYPNQDASIHFQAMGQRGKIYYDVGGNIQYLVRNGGIHFETPGMKTWLGTIPSTDITSGIKKRQHNWKIGANWIFPEEQSLWNVELSGKDSKVQWKIDDSWNTLAKNIYWQTADGNRFWMESSQTGIQSQGNLFLTAEHGIVLRSKRTEIENEGQLTKTGQFTVDSGGGIELAARGILVQRTNRLISHIISNGYEIKSSRGDWDWLLENGRFTMKIMGEQDTGWNWESQNENTSWNIQLGSHQYWNWNREASTFETNGNISWTSHTGKISFYSHHSLFQSTNGFHFATGESGNIFHEVGKYFQIKLSRDDAKYELTKQFGNIDFRIGNANHSFSFSGDDSIQFQSLKDFSVKASHSKWLLSGDLGFHLQCQKPFSNIKLEAGEGGLIELKGQKLIIQCNDWVWQGNDSFHGYQTKGWFWGSQQGKIRAQSGDPNIPHYTWSGGEGGIELKTYNLEQPIQLSSRGPESYIQLNAERSGLLLKSGGIEGLNFHIELHDELENGIASRGWQVNMKNAPIQWDITGYTFWKTQIDGSIDFCSKGNQGGFKRGICLDGNADLYDWTETISNRGIRTREIHYLNQCATDSGILEWDWGQPNSVWIATIGNQIRFHLNQSHAHFMVEALQEGSSITLQSFHHILLQSQQSHIFLDAKQNIHFKSQKLIENRIEEGTWKLRVHKVPENITRAFDVQVNGQTYLASTNHQVYRCSNDIGMIHQHIGKDMPDIIHKRGFIWTQGNQQMSFDENSLKVRQICVEDIFTTRMNIKNPHYEMNMKDDCFIEKLDHIRLDKRFVYVNDDNEFHFVKRNDIWKDSTWYVDGGTSNRIENWKKYQVNGISMEGCELIHMEAIQLDFKGREIDVNCDEYHLNGSNLVYSGKEIHFDGESILLETKRFRINHSTFEIHLEESLKINPVIQNYQIELSNQGVSLEGNVYFDLNINRQDIHLKEYVKWTIQNQSILFEPGKLLFEIDHMKMNVNHFESIYQKGYLKGDLEISGNIRLEGEIWNSDFNYGFINVRECKINMEKLDFHVKEIVNEVNTITTIGRNEIRRMSQMEVIVDKMEMRVDEWKCYLGNQTEWKQKSGVMKWEFLENGGVWEWDGREKMAQFRLRCAKVYEEIGTKEENRIRGMMEVENLKRKEGGDFGVENVLSSRYFMLDDSAVSWEDWRGLKCEKISMEKRWVSESSMTYLGSKGKIGIDGGVWGMEIRGDGIQFRRGWVENILFFDEDGLKWEGNLLMAGTLSVDSIKVEDGFLQSDKKLIISSPLGIDLDGDVRIYGVWNGGKGIRGDEPKWVIDYPMVEMRRVECESLVCQKVETKVMKTGEMKVENLKSENCELGVILRSKTNHQTMIDEPLREEEVGAFLDGIELMRETEEQIEGFMADGERLTTTVDLWNIVLMLMSEVKRLRRLKN